MIRYLWADVLAVVVLLIYLFESIKDISSSTLYLLISIGGFLAAPVAYMLAKLIKQKLIENRSSFLDRTPPGGVWLFILIGAVVGILLFILELISGKTIVSEAIVVVSSLLISLFIIIGVYILSLERKHAKKIYIGIQGFIFRE